MKKVVILFVAVMLALPAMSYAGSATSRWDLTIGGMVKLDYHYADQSINQDITNPERQSAFNTSSRDKYGASSWGIGETRLNFLVKGPDTWGAKTSAFVEGDFRSMTSNSISATTRNSVEDYGLFNLRHAFMKFDWPTFSIVAGRTWSIPGNQPCFCLLGVNEIGAFNKGILAEQIYGVWQVAKAFSITGGVMSPYSINSWPGGSPANGITVDEGFQRSNLPLFFSEVLYKSDACGKIGPWMLQFGLGGIYGQEKRIEPAQLAPLGDINTQGGTAGLGLNTVSNPGIAGVNYSSLNGFADQRVDMWMVTFKSYIPIIPEKAPGKLAGSLGLAVAAFTGQNMRGFAGAPPFKLATYSYNRALLTTPVGLTNVPPYTAAQLNTQLVNPNADYKAPVNTGGWGQLAFYWTDTLWSGFYYGQNKTTLSNVRKGNLFNISPAASANAIAISPGAIERSEEYHVNLVYDPNPAIRLGLEYSRYNAHYARNLYATGTATFGTTTIVTNGLTSNGNVNSIRFSAQYFF